MCVNHDIIWDDIPTRTKNWANSLRLSVFFINFFCMSLLANMEIFSFWLLTCLLDIYKKKSQCVGVPTCLFELGDVTSCHFLQIHKYKKEMKGRIVFSSWNPTINYHLLCGSFCLQLPSYEKYRGTYLSPKGLGTHHGIFRWDLISYLQFIRNNKKRSLHECSVILQQSQN